MTKSFRAFGNRQEVFRIKSCEALPIPRRKPQILALRLSEYFLQFT